MQKMDSTTILKALERERKLLEYFICLSEQRLLSLEEEKAATMNSLLQRRADLMIELTAIQTTLGTWISQIQDDPSVTPVMMSELRAINNEIVSMANHIVEIDVQTDAHLDWSRKGLHQTSRKQPGRETTRSKARSKPNNKVDLKS